MIQATLYIQGPSGIAAVKTSGYECLENEMPGYRFIVHKSVGTTPDEDFWTVSELSSGFEFADGVGKDAAVHTAHEKLCGIMPEEFAKAIQKAKDQISSNNYNLMRTAVWSALNESISPPTELELTDFLIALKDYGYEIHRLPATK